MLRLCGCGPGACMQVTFYLVLSVPPLVFANVHTGACCALIPLLGARGREAVEWAGRHWGLTPLGVSVCPGPCLY